MYSASKIVSKTIIIQEIQGKSCHLRAHISHIRGPVAISKSRKALETIKIMYQQAKSSQNSSKIIKISLKS